MIDESPIFQQTAYASMAAFTAAANVYNSFYPNINCDPINYFPSNGKLLFFLLKNIFLFFLDMKRERLDPKISVKLEDEDLWKRFSSLDNEMIITKFVRHQEKKIFF